jgi:hypothetical protein
MFSRWDLTVASVMNSRTAASRLVFPAATSSRTSSSRALSSCGAGVRIRFINRPATEGDSTLSPLAAARAPRSSSSRGESLRR